MLEVLSAAQTAAADRAAVAAGLASSALMRAAGRSVADVVCTRYGRGEVLVLCGPGNNGGDGYIAAAELRLRGWTVRVMVWAPPATNDAQWAFSRWHDAKGEVIAWNPAQLGAPSVVVDAVFGAGLRGTLPVQVAHLLAEVSARDVAVVAVDVPTGIVGDTGEVQGPARADVTVTFARKKPAHLLMPGRERCGNIVVADIGITDLVIADVCEKRNHEDAPRLWENAPSLWKDAWPYARAEHHKYSRGAALLWGGAMTGAGRLMARAAGRAGAGLVSIIVPGREAAIYQKALESTIVHVDDAPESIGNALGARRFGAIGIGPGAGLGERTRAAVREFYAAGLPMVIDADALTYVNELPQPLGTHVVMTPHGGEFDRCWPVQRQSKADKLSRTLVAAAGSGAIVVHKGSDTVIAAPDGRAVLCPPGPVTLATAGSGDVLTGLLVGLLARGMAPFEAACAAVWLHSEAARAFGPGLLADDLPDLVPRVMCQAALL